MYTTKSLRFALRRCTLTQILLFRICEKFCQNPSCVRSVVTEVRSKFTRGVAWHGPDPAMVSIISERVVIFK